MKTTTISDRDAFELANGRVPARPDLDPLADLLTAYRSAAIGSAPRPSAALSARLDLSATPIAMQRDAVADEGSASVGTRRAASGLLGLGVTVAIILGAASGAAAVVGAGSAGLLPPGAQDAFDQVVSVIAPPGVVGQETNDQGEVPGTSADQNVPGGAVEPAPVVTGETTSPVAPVAPPLTSPGDGGNGNGNSVPTDPAVTSPGNSGSSNGNSGAGNNGNGNGNGGPVDPAVTSPGNSGSSNGNSGGGNNGNGNGNGGPVDPAVTSPGNSGSSNGNSGNNGNKP